MTKRWLYAINLGLVGISLLLAILALGFYFTRPLKIPLVELTPKTTKLPKGAFIRKKEEYNAIGPPLLNLRFSPMSLQLPELRNYLVYYGKNERPDADHERSLLHFSFSGSKVVTSIPPGEKLYLVYDKNQPRIKYLFSPENAETSLWITVNVNGKEATVDISMKNETGKIIRKPEKYAQFTLKAKEFTRFGREKWELGKWRVDGTLLARQRARWYGQDLFLENHGGEEYREFLGKQRIDLGENDEAYSIYLGVGDSAAWVDGRWKEVEPGEDSREHPLLVVNKVDERLMKMELWDVSGKAKASLNLIKSAEPPIRQQIENTFKFVGARTKSQLMFEVDDKRILISPKDWLLYIDETWKKLVTPEEIDDYVNRKTVGPLFVVVGMKTEEGRQILVGTLYNSTRTDIKSVEIPMQQTTKLNPFSFHKKLSSGMTHDSEEEEEEDLAYEGNRHLGKFRQRGG